jgi:hypothetical protein
MICVTLLQQGLTCHDSRTPGIGRRHDGPSAPSAGRADQITSGERFSASRRHWRDGKNVATQA